MPHVWTHLAQCQEIAPELLERQLVLSPEAAEDERLNEVVKRKPAVRVLRQLDDARDARPLADPPAQRAERNAGITRRFDQRIRRNVARIAVAVDAFAV